MRLLDDAFTLVHIKISHLKFMKMPLRRFLTMTLIFLLLTNGIRLFWSLQDSSINADFVETLIITITICYGSLSWVRSWPKASKMLSKASIIGEED